MLKIKSFIFSVIVVLINFGVNLFFIHSNTSVVNIYIIIYIYISLNYYVGNKYLLLNLKAYVIRKLILIRFADMIVRNFKKLW